MKNPRDTGIAFGSVLVVLLAVKYVSIISVLANLCLALVTATVAFRIYKSVLAAVHKTQEGHPFKQYFECDVTLPVDKVQSLADCVVGHLNNLIARLKKIFLVEDLIESLKFAGAMYMLTYIGGWINGLSIVIAAWVAIFSVPKIYKDNQSKIDEALKPVKAKIDEFTSKLKAAPVAEKKEE